MYHAVVYDRRAPEGVVVVEKNVPKAVRRGHVLVRVKACGVNPVDAKYCVGDKLPEALPEGFRRWTVQGGGVGFDLAGVVEALPPSAGEACDGFRVGDAVFGSMPPLKASFAELAEVPTHQLAAMPEGLSFPEAAALPLVGTTAMQALRHRHGLSEGQRVLIIGASGGVGSVAVQVAKDLVGAGGHVAAVCSARNHEMVKGLGADAAYDYTQGLDKLMEELSERYREAPLDLVLDCVSSLEAKDRVFDYNARVHAAGILKREPNTSGSRSNYIVIGGGFGDWFRALMFRTAGINCFGASHELFWIVFPHSRPVLDELKAAVERGALRAFIEEVPVDGFAAVEPVREAFRRLHGRRVRGKLVFVL